MSAWCLVGNVVAERAAGEGGQERKRGSKHFAPGTKLYCLPMQWGDGYESIKVVGRQRGSKRYVTMVIEAAWVTNWRTRVVYSPEVLRRLEAAGRLWASQAEVEAYVAWLTTRTATQPPFREET